jgi:hypothetical protein
MAKPASDVAELFNAFLALSSDDQRIFAAMVRGRTAPAPPAQATIPIPPAGAKRSHKKTTLATSGPEAVPKTEGQTA